ncbi:zinc-binding dehydrogenase [Actinomadura nitritigenes]|uniref:zinc-binding dehydrogenase n=1 Tax=Actinomadura nitritigenes TaxID=134602 RepID=UPI003D8BF089
MKAIKVRAFGAPDVLRLEEVPDPVRAAGRVLISVDYSAVLFGDVIVRSGRHPFPLPYVPGIEVAGRVVEAGDPSLVDRRVVATTPQNRGGYAELAVAEESGVFAVPDALDLRTALTAFQAGAVALQLLAGTGVQAGETVLVTAAAGRVGSLLVQLAAAAGARVVAAAHGEAKLAAAAGFGADLTVDYGEEGWADEVVEATGGGVDVVLDAVGGATAARAMDAAATGRGRIGIYGFTSGEWAPLDARVIGARGLTVVGALGIAFAKPPAEQRAAAERALEAAASGELSPRVHAEFFLDEAARAHTVLEARENIGAVLLK